MTITSNPASFSGTIALLDVLGAGAYDIGKSMELIAKRNECVNRAFSALEEASKKSAEKFGNASEYYYQILTPSVLTFGDTIAFVWRDEDGKELYQLDGVIAFVSLVHNMLFHRGEFVRGSIARGEIVFDPDSNTVLGPAVAASARCYDKHQMIGVIADESLSSSLTSLYDSDKSGSFIETYGSTFEKYQVPYKGGKKQDLWTLNWPSVMSKHLSQEALSKRGFQSAGEVIANKLDQHEWPERDIEKRKNTMEFVERLLGS